MEDTETDDDKLVIRAEPYGPMRSPGRIWVLRNRRGTMMADPSLRLSVLLDEVYLPDAHEGDTIDLSAQWRVEGYLQ